MKQAVIVSGTRSPVGKAKRGSLSTTRPDELAAATIKELLRRTPDVQPEAIDDIIFGTAMPEKEQGFNLARIISLAARIPHSVPAVTINRFCATGLQAIAMAAERIMTGGAEIIIAGGVESMSYLPFNPMMRMAPNPTLAHDYPDAYLGMGLTAENVAVKYDISREDSDNFALASHQKAISAIKNGHFKHEIAPITVRTKVPDGNGAFKAVEKIFDTDEGPRGDTSLEKLSRLKPVFKADGQVTAGNSSQTSDGAACVLVMSATKAKELELTPIAKFKGFTVAGVAPEIMGIGPVEAVPKLLRSTGTTLNDIDLIELNEAFACQSLAVIRELELPDDKVNVNGGAVALGHPLGCTGAKLTLTLIHELQRRGGGLGLVTMCVGGGMGAAGLIEVTSN